MRWLLAIVPSLLLAPSAAASERWGELPDPKPRTAGAPPSKAERLQAFETMQLALEQWERERRDFLRDLQLREQLLHERRGEGPETAAAARGRRGKGGRKGKVIEVAPEEEPAPRSQLDEELEKAEARAEESLRRKREDPEGFAREKARRAALAEGNRAWDEAVERRWKKRQVEIEAEARRFQAELDAARRREAQSRARKLGGSLDQEGNFVDEDLAE